MGSYAIAYLLEFKSQQQLRAPRQSTILTRWTAPDEGILKISVDGAFSEREAGIGAAVRDHNGQVEALMAERIENCLSAEHVECIAFLRALQFVKDFGTTHFIVEGDALGILQRINKQSPDLSLLGNVISCCWELLSEFPFVKICHVSRKSNEPAHLLAHKALALIGDHVWFTDFPKDVLYAANADLS